MDITVKSFGDLTVGERARLLELSPPHIPERRELFRCWLQSPDPQDMYAAIVRLEGRIVGWAGANLRDGPDLGMIGVVVEPESRRHGFARAAVQKLARNLKHRHPESPAYLYYEPGYEPLFSAAVEAAGFKDLWRHLNEYRARLRRTA